MRRIIEAELPREPLDPDSDSERWEAIEALMSAHSNPPPRQLHHRELASGYLVAGQLSCIFGASGQTKSVLAIDHACRLASAITWSDGGEVEPDPEDRQNVLYIAAERPEQVRRRVDAFVMEHKLAPLSNLVIYSGPVDLCAEDDRLLDIVDVANRMIYNIPHEEIDFIVIDTLAAAMSKPVSDTHATNTASHNLVRLAHYQGAHVMCVHHQPVTGEPRMSGGHLAAAMDLIIHVKKTAGGSVAQVVKDNGRDQKQWVRLHYSLKSIDMEFADGTTASEPIVVPDLEQPKEDRAGDGPLKRGKALTDGQAEVLAALSKAIGASGETSASIEEWRAAYDATEKIGETATARRMRFHRGSKALMASEKVVAASPNKWSISA